jgi:hypothetical protein
MPLYPDATDLIRANLLYIQSGYKAKMVAIGTLTLEQLSFINAERASHTHPLLPIIAEVVFIGGHIHASRIVRDRYTINDVIDQIVSAMDSTAVVVKVPTMTAVQNQKPRLDNYGNMVRDRMILECSTKHPRPELYSVMPKGDHNKPPWT